MKGYFKDTQLVHADRLINSPEDGAVHQSITKSVLFDFQDVADLEAVFQGKKAGHVYSRSSSASCVSLQNILAHLEGGIASTVFATGMAAISAALLSLLKAGDHIIVSQYLFGNTRSFMSTLEQFAIEIDFVDVTNVNDVANVIKPNTKMVFTETIANPGTQVADLKAIGELCAQSSILYIVDNTMTPFVMLDASTIQANLVMTSLTKYIAGHGNVLGGVVIDMGNYDWTTYGNISNKYKTAPDNMWGTTQIRKRGLRDMGATLAPENAHQISVGLETLALRFQKQSQTAFALAEFMEKHSAFSSVNYPGLAAHPQHMRAESLFKGQYGAILSFEIADHIDMRTFLNQLHLILSATHLGDTRTLALPVATTIFYENGAEQRAQMKITDGLIRLSVGLENSDDLIQDIEQAVDMSSQ